MGETDRSDLLLFSFLFFSFLFLLFILKFLHEETNGQSGQSMQQRKRKRRRRKSIRKRMTERRVLGGRGVTDYSFNLWSLHHL